MHVVNDQHTPKRRVRVERGIYRQRAGKHAVCFMLDGKPRFRTVGYDLDLAREERRAFVEAARWGGLAGRAAAGAALMRRWLDSIRAASSVLSGLPSGWLTGAGAHGQPYAAARRTADMAAVLVLDELRREPITAALLGMLIRRARCQAGSVA